MILSLTDLMPTTPGRDWYCGTDPQSGVQALLNFIAINRYAWYNCSRTVVARLNELPVPLLGGRMSETQSKLSVGCVVVSFLRIQMLLISVAGRIERLILTLRCSSYTRY